MKLNSLLIINNKLLTVGDKKSNISNILKFAVKT